MTIWSQLDEVATNQVNNQNVLQEAESEMAVISFISVCELV